MSLFDLFLAFLWGAGAAAALSYCFNISYYDIVWGALIGGLGWAVYTAALSPDGSASVLSYFWGALVVAFLSEILAIIIKKPATIYIVPGLLPFVPGGDMFRTMRAAVEGNLQESLNIGFATLSAAGAIAVAIALSSSASRIVKSLIKYLHNKRDKESHDERT